VQSIPRIISVDDHVLEPPDLWSVRLPKKFVKRGPRVERRRLTLAAGNGAGGKGWIEADDAPWADVWLYDGLVSPVSMLSAAIGFEELAFTLTTYDEVRPGCWKQTERLQDMDDNHVDAALCFPNTLPRFCGQTFTEGADRELGLACIQAYNDWVIDDWCGAAGRGRLIPVTILPLWDAEMAAAELRRCAAKGSFAVTFPENPYPLGLPSLNDPNHYWDPVFAACQETETTLCMHIGSSSKMPATSPDAPYIINSTLTFQNAMGSLCDFIFSGTLDRVPHLKIAYAEGQVGWMPYVLERADALWSERGPNSFGSMLPRRPSEYMAGRVYGCIFDDPVGLLNRDIIGMDQICFETDYPHADTTFPHTKQTLTDICTRAALNDEEIYKLARGNAIKAFGLQRVGLSQ
jgi:predicted TIM-barrel fold metal-dependent hydrolase